jgi:transposase
VWSKDGGQSTGVYWIPLYEILEEHGFEVYLVNARHTKNLPGRKSDVQEQAGQDKSDRPRNRLSPA